MTSVSSKPAIEARRLWNVVFTMLIDNNYNSPPHSKKLSLKNEGKWKFLQINKNAREFTIKDFAVKDIFQEKGE